MVSQKIEGMADGGIDGDAAQAIRAAAFGADDEVGERKRDGLILGTERKLLSDPQTQDPKERTRT